MTISELQIQLDLNRRNEKGLLEKYASLTDFGYLFVDDNDGKCYLFDKNGQLDDIKKINTMLDGYIKKDIKKIVIPNCVKSIRGWAFWDCAFLTSIKIPSSVESIGNYVFGHCTSLTHVKIPESVKSIGNYVFGHCTSLTHVKIPESVKSIRDEAFMNCTSLTSIVFKGKTIDQVRAMDYYPWGIKDESIIKCS